MPKEPARVASVSLAELISDPIVQALMKADNVTVLHGGEQTKDRSDGCGRHFTDSARVS